MFSQFQQYAARSACALILFALPGGTAAQSIALFSVVLLGLWLGYRQGGILSLFKPVTRAEAWSWFFYLSFTLWLLMSTVLNEKNTSHGLLQHFIGYSAIVLVPTCLALAWKAQAARWAQWNVFATILCVIWALVCISQYLWGWQMVGTQIVTNDHFRRARGFYSHPLTLAYVLLAFWPFVVIRVLRMRQEWTAWVQFLAIALMLVLSGSRTVQACALLGLCWAFLAFFKGRQRKLLIVGIILGGLTAVFIPHPFSKRFQALISGQDPDRFSDYPDDRLAFWHAFSGIIAERPILGHGISLDHEYRRPYYEAIGLGDFRKQYEAHNQLIQILAEGGMIGLCAFLLWLFFVMRAYPCQDPHQKLMRQQIFVLLLLAGFSQNAFQDSELRYALILLLSLAKAQYGLEARSRPSALPSS